MSAAGNQQVPAMQLQKYSGCLFRGNIMHSTNRTLVTGAAGFIGQELVRQLTSRNVSVRATDIREPARTCSPNPDLEFVKADICNPRQVAELFEGVDRVIHSAGICNLTASYKSLERVNVAGTALTSGLALENDVDCFVHMSSTSVYGTYKGQPFDEESECIPEDNYGKSKLAGEEQVRLRMAQGLNAIILRPCTVYGPGCNDGAGKVFSRPSAIGGIPGDGRQKLANVRVEDVAAAAIFLSETESTFGKTCNIADNSQPELEEALIIAAETFGSKISKRHVPLSLMKIVARVKGGVARLRHKIPDLEYEAIKYLYDDYVVDNSRLISTGFKLIYPDFRTSMNNLAAKANNLESSS